MKVNVIIDGGMRKFLGGLTSKEFTIKEEMTLEDFLKEELNIIFDETKEFGFAVINGKKAPKDLVLKDNDKIRIFRRAFGG